MSRNTLSLLRFAIATSVLTGLSLSPATRLAFGASQPTVKIRQGKLEGKQDGAVRAFLGIPYAAPPVGPLRWHPPLPAAAWSGMRQATTFGSHCMQPNLYSDMIFRDPGISEDCLTLNVWTPAKDKTAALPVMVWIYGGGFVTGGTSEPRQDGAHLATKGVVVVTMNYRLGIFGFFAHPELSAESGHGASGNYGLLDQTAALHWVQENIKAFGGDPANVTLFGESAGSFAVSDQMASPLASGLFKHAIGESGGAFSSSSLAMKTLQETEAQDAAFATAKLGTSTLAELRALPAEKILAAANEKPEPGSSPVRFAPDVDGYFLPESVAAIFAAHKQNDVPLLAGWNRDEGGFAAGTTTDTLQDALRKQFPDHADEALKVYSATDDTEAVRALSDMQGDKFIAYSTWRWLEAQVTTSKQPVYRFRFDLAPPADPNHPGGLAAYHSSEIPYVFGDLDLLQGFAWRPEDHALSEQMEQYWTNFARTGDPNGPGLPQWPVYAPASGWETMHLSPQSAAEPDKNRPRDLFLDTVWGK
jgi:para-nitrobenzyl esterase